MRGRPGTGHEAALGAGAEVGLVKGSEQSMPVAFGCVVLAPSSREHCWARGRLSWLHDGVTGGRVGVQDGCPICLEGLGTTGNRNGRDWLNDDGVLGPTPALTCRPIMALVSRQGVVKVARAGQAGPSVQGRPLAGGATVKATA